jgi:hypothetical protein
MNQSQAGDRTIYEVVDLFIFTHGQRQQQQVRTTEMPHRHSAAAAAATTCTINFLSRKTLQRERQC